jgi:FkbM family methyltransferase
MDASPWGRHRPDRVARFVLSLSRNTILGRGRARLMMMRMFAALHEGPADVTLWGAPARLHPADNHAERKALINPARYDRAERDFVVAGLQADGAVYVDVGANFGLYVIDALMRAPKAQALAIEPQQAMIDRLRFNLRLLDSAGHDASARTLLAPMAAGAEEGVLRLQRGPDASIRRLSDSSGASAGEAVPVRPLLAILEEAGIERIAVLKIDVEGWEDQVLRPFLQNARVTQLPRRVVIEHAHRGEWGGDSIALLHRRGYRTLSATRANTLLELKGTIG